MEEPPNEDTESLPGSDVRADSINFSEKKLRNKKREEIDEKLNKEENEIFHDYKIVMELKRKLSFIPIDTLKAIDRDLHSFIKDFFTSSATLESHEKHIEESKQKLVEVRGNIFQDQDIPAKFFYQLQKEKISEIREVLNRVQSPHLNFILLHSNMKQGDMPQQKTKLEEEYKLLKSKISLLTANIYNLNEKKIALERNLDVLRGSFSQNFLKK